MKKRFQQIIDTLLKRGKISTEDRADLNQEEQAIVDTAKMLIAGRHEDKPYRMEFKEELKQQVLALHGAKQVKRKKTKKTIWRALHIKTLAGTGIGVIAVAAVVAFSIFQQSGLINIIKPGQSGGILIPVAHAYDNFTLTPDVVDDYGVIAQDTDFLLTSEAKISKDELETYLTLSNGDDFSIETIRRGYEYRIDPKSDLGEGEILQVTAATVTEGEDGMVPFTYQWVFEVADHFKIQSTTPDDRSSGIATNSAVEIIVSHAKTVDISAYLDIQPNHNVKIEQDFRTIRLIPSEPWQDQTFYTITIKEGFGVDSPFIPADQDESLWRLEHDYSLAFTTGTIAPLENGSMSFVNTSLQSKPGEQVKLSGWGYELPDTAPLFVTVHKLDQTVIDQVVKATARLQDWIPARLKTRLSQQVIQDFGLTNGIVSYQINPKKNYSQSVFTLDAIQNEGVYLVEAKIGGQTQLFFWSVSKVGAYMMMTETGGFVWTVDTETNQPVDGVSVHTNEQFLGTSDSRGIVEVDAAQVRELQEYDAFKLVKGSATTIHPILIWGDPTDQRPEYQGFLQLDQYLVHSDDVVKFWGIVQRKDAQVQTVTAQVELWGAEFGDFGQVIVQEMDVTVDEDGFYQGQMTLADLRDGYYQLSILDQDEFVRGKSFTVKQFATPELAITVNPQYQRVDAGEDNRVTISTARFDGTPARFIDLRVEAGTFSRTVTTDDLGQAIVVVPSRVQDCGQRGCSSWEYVSMSVTPIGPFETEVKGSASWNITQKYQEIDFWMDDKGDFIDVTVTVRGKDFLTNDSSYPKSDEIAHHPAKGVPFQVDVNQIRSEKSELLSEVDPLTNQTAFYYNFSQVTENVDIHEGLTDQEGKIRFTVPKVDQTNYEVVVRAKDRLDRFDVDSHTFAQFSLPRGKVYVENETDENFIEVIKDYDPYRHLSVDYEYDYDTQYKVGSEIEFEAFLGEGKLGLLPNDATVLFYTISPNFEDVFISNSAMQSIQIKESYYPNFFVGAATVYDGNLYFTDFHLTQVSLSQEPYKLDIDIATEKENYGIRDEVKATVLVKDATGEPTEAMVNINVLDKAYLELDSYASTQNPVVDLMARQYSRILVNTGTHHFSMGADGLGGGGGDGRSNFLEQASYQFVRTNSDGIAEFTFTLPDNITSWVINAAAATKELQGGVEQKEVTVAQSFVVQSIQSDSYLLDDAIVISAQNFNDSLATTEEVAYAFYGPLVKEDGKQYSLEDFPVASQTKSALSTEIADFEVSLSEMGEYVYALRGTAGDLEDIIIKSFEVMPGRGTTPILERMNITNDWNAPVPDNALGRVSVRFASPYGAEAYDALNDICDCSTRLDYFAAKKRSAGLAEQYFNIPSDYTDQKVTTEYKHPDGGYTRFPLGSADIALTSSVAAALGQEANVIELASYFNEVLAYDPTPREAALAFRGLGALQQAGYAKLVAFTERDDFDYETRLILADAFLLYGDLENARRLFDRVLVDTELTNGQRFFPNAENAEMAELARLVALAIGNSSWSEFHTYVNAQGAFADPVSFVRFWELQLERQPITKMSFVVEIGEESQFVTLNGFESFGIDVTQEQLANLVVRDIRGNVEVLYWYYRAGQEPQSISGLQVNRFYDQGAGYTTTIDPEKEIDVLIEVRPSDASAYGTYQLQDLLPSGLQAITRGQQWGLGYGRCNYAPYRTSLHYVKSYVRLDEDCPAILIQYRARAVANAGTYKAEGLSLTKLDNPEIRYVGEAEMIEVQ